jgi:shikimate kinase
MAKRNSFLPYSIFVREDGRTMKRHLFLVGFMGTGKSTVARELGRLQKNLVFEMDDWIVQQEGCTISDIFATYGEAYFRQKETRVLQELQHYTPQIVSCGGGVVLRKENLAYLKQGDVIWLRAKAQTIYKRVSGGTTRPVLAKGGPLEHIQTLMQEREPFYAAVADWTVDTDEKSALQIARQISRQIKEKEKCLNNSSLTNI